MNQHRISFVSLALSSQRGGAAVSANIYTESLRSNGFLVEEKTFITHIFHFKYTPIIENALLKLIIIIDQAILRLLLKDFNRVIDTNSFYTSSLFGIIGKEHLKQYKYKVIHNIQPFMIKPSSLMLDGIILVHHDGYWSNMFNHYTSDGKGKEVEIKFARQYSLEVKSNVMRRAFNIFPSKWLYNYTLSRMGIEQLPKHLILSNHAPTHFENHNLIKRKITGEVINIYIIADNIDSNVAKGSNHFKTLTSMLSGDISFSENIRIHIFGSSKNGNVILNVSNQLQIVYHGRVESRKLPEMIESMECCLHISLSQLENCSMSILEAMALGIPSIAFDVGGNNELIKNSINGFIIQDNDVKSIISHIYPSQKIDSHDIRDYYDKTFSSSTFSRKLIEALFDDGN